MYERILSWGPMWEPLFEPAGIGEGHVVLDFGAGPGHVTIEMAGRVGPSGQVHAVDVNEEFLRRTAAKASDEGYGDRVSTHLLEDHRVPLADGSIDRVLAKNVLEYVPSAADVLAECFRVTAPGGRMTATDWDWDFLIIQPWSVEEQREFFAAGAHAFKEPNIGRKLRALMLDAGFVDIDVSVHTAIDTRGGLIGVVRNFVGYIAEYETMAPERVLEMLNRLEEAVESGRYLAVLPQFSVTGLKAG